MTVRVTTLKGPAAGLYYVHELGGYYLEAGEPAGAWVGAEAASLGLGREARPDDFLALMAGKHPATGEQLGRAYGERSARGYDVTMSAPKSVSVLWAVSDDATRAHVEQAMEVAARSVIHLIEDQAHTRVKPVSTMPVAVVDAQGIAACLFRQHTSRSLDPQLHVHGVVIAKVRDNHDRWKALDARMVKRDQRTLSAVFHATLRSELTGRLGVEWQAPVNGIAEMAGVDPAVLATFSHRSAQVEQRTQVKLDRFRSTLGREPNDVERWRLEREAVTDSRPSKPHGQAADDHHARWQRELRDLGIEPARLQDDMTGRVRPRLGVPAPERAAVSETAMDALVGERSAWRRNDIIRELARAWPTDTAADPDRLRQGFEVMADTLIEQRLVELNPKPGPLIPRRRSDGRPVTESTLDRQLSTPSILAEERWLTDWAQDRWTTVGRTRSLEGGRLDHAQHAVAQEVAGTAPLVVVVGPAGAGKTAALRPAVADLQRRGQPVFGVAPSATAASVLRDGTGAPCDTIAKLLVEHSRAGGPGAGLDLPAGTTLLVDEAGMVATPDLADLSRLADARNWRVVLIGDPQQLAPVGRGGMFGHLARIGPTLELDRVHRFAERWERDASIRLRTGDSDVVDVYDRHGRIHPAATRIDATRAAIDQWDAARRQGSVVMLAASNDTVAELNADAQHLRLMKGELTGILRPASTGAGQPVYVGDRIVTRQNDRTLRTDRGVSVRNRATWTVTLVRHDGAIDASGPDGTIRLPADYVHRAVELGYAQTVHGAQGATVDRAILVVDGPTDGRGIYVGLTRGAERNDAIVVTGGNNDAVDVLASCVAQDWTDRPATEVLLELVEQARSLGEPRIDLTDVDSAISMLSDHRLDEAILAALRGPSYEPVDRTAPPVDPTPPDRGMGLEL